MAASEPRLNSFLAEVMHLSAIDSPTGYIPGIVLTSDWFVARLTALGATLTESTSPRYGPTRCLTLAGGGSRHVVLIGHVDTVYPCGTAVERPPRIDGDRLIGPGTSDMKAGLLAAVYALEQLIADGPLPLTVSVIINPDEEIGSPSSKQFMADISRQADAVLVLEAARANGGVVTSRKAIGVFHIDVHGRNAHAGADPDRGRNAIVELAHRIIAVHSLNGRIPGVTLNVGVVSGGTVSNVVPDHAWVQIDVRAPTQAAVAAITSSLHAVCQQTIILDTTASLSGGFNHPPMERNQSTQRLYMLAQQAAAEIDIALPDMASGGASDANSLAALGIPVLDGLGPVGAGGHSPQEYLHIPTAMQRVALLARCLDLLAE